MSKINNAPKDTSFGSKPADPVKAANQPSTTTKQTEQKAEPKPTTTVKVGEILHYRIAKDDATERNDLRKTAAHQHQGHKLEAGEVVPFIVTALGNDGKFNGQALLDGNDSLWVKGVTLGDEDGQCARPRG